jgi:DNA polymerase III delta prime subunit
MNFTRVVKSVEHKRLWCDDARPEVMEEFIGNSDICNSLYNSLEYLSSSLLLVGPHGCGKTTFARLIAKKLLGDQYSKNLLELYSSINRNKNYIGNKILIDNKNIHDFINNCNSTLKLKLIIMYDIDTAAYDTQQIFCDLLRQKNVTIIFTCNSTQTIHENLLSNVMSISMCSLVYDEIMKKLCEIEKKKNMTMTEEVKKSLCIICNGDLKKLFNIMQLLSGISGTIDLVSFYKLIDMPSYACIKDLLLWCEKGNIQHGFKKLNEILSNGYCNLDILDIIEKTLLYIDILEPSFDIEKQIHMLSIVTQCIMFKKHTRLQLYKMVSEMATIV